MNSDGSNPQEYPLPTGFFAGSFTWSPDSTQIAFLANEFETKDGKVNLTGKHHLKLINADGTNLQNLIDLRDFPFPLVAALSWAMIP